jgi:O-antigen/teichoic acid export membrane protein
MSATRTYVAHIRRLQSIPLFKNSFFIILNKGVVALAGFAFWILATHFYSTNDVGIATALISSASLIMQFSYLGFDYSIIRFFSKYDRSRMFNTCLILTVLTAVTLGAVYIAFVNVFSPELGFLQSPVYALVFLAYITINVVSTIGSTTFIAARKAEFSFLQNLLLLLRLPLLIPLVFLGAFGILTSIGLAYVLVCLAIVYLVGQFVRLKFTIDPEFVRTSLKFSFGNYVAQIFLNFTYLALPMMILSILGSEEAAKYYIAYTIGNLLLQVPDAVGMSLFVEGSHGEAMRKNVLRAGTAMYAVLIPGVIFIFLFGDRLLSLFHGVYSPESLTLLRLFAIVSLFFAVYCLMVPVQNVRMNVKRIIKINMIIFVLFMGMSYLFMTHIGIVGVGVALLLTYAIVDVIILGLAKVEGWI